MSKPRYSGSGSPDTSDGSHSRYRPKVIGSGSPFEEDTEDSFVDAARRQTAILKEIYALDGRSYPPQQAAPAPIEPPPPPPQKRDQAAEIGQLMRDLAERPDDPILLDIVRAMTRGIPNDR